MLRFTVLCLSLAAASASAAPLIELTSSGQPIRGRQIAHNKQACWMTDQDGRLIEVPLATVTDFRTVADEFQPRPVNEVRKALAAELGPGFEIAIRGRYVVAAPRGKADQFASLFDQTSRDFLQYLKVRKFQVVDPDLPLVAVVYPNRIRFLEQCAKDDVPAGPVLRGYYDQRSNRVTLYDDPQEQTAASAPAATTKTSSTRSTSRTAQANSPTSTPAEMSLETAVHEAIHQIAFNAGLHSRLGGDPVWVVEGLAMQFERGKDGYVKTRTSERVNLSRLINFDDYRRQRRKAGTLAQMIASDDLLRKSALDGYGEAWLLTNYLIETRPQKFGWYLQTLAARNPLEAYSPEERLRDFEANFGKDLAWLEVEFLRYAEKVADEALPDSSMKKR